MLPIICSMRWLLLMLVLGVPTVLPGQVVRGIVRDSASGEPVSGALVTLVRRPSGERRTVLTDEGGRFTIGAPGAGTYVLETKRIGVRPLLTPTFTLAEGEARELATAVAPVVARLDAVRVTGRSYCGERVAEGAETATLWDEVRAALTATRITRERASVPVTITNFTRTLDPTSYTVRHEERSERHGVTANPFQTAPAASLSAHGYIVPDGDALQYRGPDADVLLSDAFVREHCFRATRGTSERVGLIGLAFEPTSARRVPDIAGVLWIDARTRELRRLEYSYTRSPIQLDGRFPLSYMDFTRMPSGAWVVQRWAIRMPQVELRRSEAPTNPMIPAEPPRQRLVAVIEQGGEAFIGVQQASRVTRTIEGSVVDSTTNRPLAGARVSLRGTPYATEANAAGRFRIELPDTGSYLLGFEHPRLDSLSFDAAARNVRVSGTRTTADLFVPPLATVRAVLCPGARVPSRNGIVHGIVRNPAGTPMGWATFKYQWSQLVAVASSAESPLPTGASVPVTTSPSGAIFVADSRGRFLICDVPPGRYRLSVESETGQRAEVDLAVATGEIVMRELRLRDR
jgi:hypothetical protein